MKLQGRHLELKMRGADVKLLQDELRDLGFELPPDEVENAVFGKGTRRAVAALQKRAGISATGVVDEETAKFVNAQHGCERTYVVRGRVLAADGRPLADLTVNAFAVRLRAEERLGEATTDAQGSYEIVYRPNVDEHGAVAVMLRALSTDGAELASSATVFAPQPVEELDLVVTEGVGAPVSEFERIAEQVRPALAGIDVADLAQDEERRDVTFVAGASGVDAQRVAMLAAAHRLGRETGLPPELFFGLAHAGLPTNLEALATLPAEARRDALMGAAAQGVVPDWVPERAEAVGSVLGDVTTRTVLESPAVEGGAPLSELLSPVLSADVQSAFAARYAAHEGSPAEFWAGLREDPELAQHVDDAQLAMGLAAVAHGHAPMVNALRAQGVDSLRELASFGPEDWTRIIAEGEGAVGAPDDVPGDDADEKVRNYARAVANAVEDAFPTDVVAHGLVRDQVPGGEDVRTFVGANPDFDITRTPVGSYLGREDVTLDGVSDVDALREQLKAVQRVYKVARYSEVRVLLADGLDSAHAMTRMSREVFMSTYGEKLGGTARARKIYDDAAQVSATALNILASHAARFNRDSLAVLPGPVADAEGSPDVESLFGSLDLCDCVHCRSVYGPAAYLVDILAFLRDRRSKLPGKSAKDILFRRRPDIGEIELTCENTNTPVSAVDQCAEIMEAAVSPATAVPARQRQTSGTPEERAANPQHLNHGAYEKLRREVYPWLLPFDLWHEQARVYLHHLGVARADLMETFRSPAGPSDVALAAERLGLTPFAAHVVTGATLEPAREAWEFWGHPAGSPPSDWTGRLANVRKFLDASGLTYDELVELLDVPFVNGRASAIVASDPADAATCDTTKLEISNLDEDALGRIHRFVRLQRALGWSLRELGRAVAALGKTDLDDGLLSMLADIDALRRELRLSGDVVLALYSPLDTTLYAEVAGRRHRPLYEELFQNPTVVVPPPGEPDLFRLNDARTELAAVGALSDERVAAAILAALRLDHASLSLLVTGPTAVVTDDTQTLEHLSRLFRRAALARALKLKVEELLQVQAITGIDPFVDAGAAVAPAATAATRMFVTAVETIRGSRFSVAELDYLLRHRSPPGGVVAPSQQAVSLTLDAIRRGIQRIVDETKLPPDAADPEGDLTRKQLAAVAMEPELIEQSVAMLAGTAVYEAPLAALPAGIAFPDELATRIAHDAAAGRLRFAGPMTTAARDALKALSTDTAYSAAVDALFAIPRTFVARRLNTFEPRTWSAPLAALAAGIEFPARLRERVFYDADRGELRFRGVMSEAERTSLTALSTDTDYRTAVDALFAAPGAFVPAPQEQFLTAADAAALFDGAMTPEQRFRLVLGKLMPYVRNALSVSLVKQQLAEALRVDVGVVEQLVSGWIVSPANTSKSALDELLDPAFVGSNLEVELTPTAFPAQFAMYARLHKIALLVTRLRLTPVELTWLRDHRTTAGWLDLNALPLTEAASGAALFEPWRRLADLVRLRDRTPLGAQALSEVLALAHDPAITEAELLAGLAAAMRWDRSHVERLAGSSGLALAFPDDYRRGDALIRLARCFALLRELGASAEQGLAWARPELTAADAEAIIRTAKSKYDQAEWHAIARPLRDEVREAQRAALVAYLLAHPDPAQGQQWEDVRGLYEYFLTDVEVSPCQMTSRIKHAIGSVQLFVQRCLMNLEPDIAATAQSDPKWREWKWMKSYRVWEANRKIFLYPENWIEPELRDDKSPFFKELENQLMQEEVTDVAAEDAFASYLENLSDVARLEICGMFHEIETSKHGATTVDRLHVIGRTPGKPHRHYHRQRVDGDYWTAWEPIDVDIESDQLIPVVWNRRLCLFWPLFTDEAEKEAVTVPAAGGSLNQPQEHLRIQMAWTERKNGKWLAKRVSRTSLLEWWGRPRESFSLKLLETSPELRIGIFIRVSPEVDGVDVDHQTFHWNWAEFRSRGCAFDLERTQDVYDVNSVATPGTHFDNQMMASLPGQKRLELQYGDLPYTNSVPTLRAARTEVVALDSTPTPYRLLTAHQDVHFESKRPFFFQDRSRTFIVSPHKKVVWQRRWGGDGLGPGALSGLKDRYWREIQPPDPSGPIEQVFDPPPFEHSFAVERVLPREILLEGVSRREAVVTPVAEREHVLREGRFVPGGGAGLVAGVDEAPMRTNGPLAAIRSAGRSLGLVTSGSAALLGADRSPFGVPRKAAVLPLARESSPFAVLTAGDATSGTLEAVSRSIATASGFTILEESVHLFEPIQIVDVLGAAAGGIFGPVRLRQAYAFAPFYHPYVCVFVRQLNRHGVDGLLQRELQLDPDSFESPAETFSFKSVYQPRSAVSQPYPREAIDFSFAGAYSSYNWELFFHAPLLIAQRLSANQRFEDAQRWFHYIFDPTDTSSRPRPQRYWRTLPFFERTRAGYEAEQIDNLLEQLASGNADPELKAQVREWRKHPFSPHVVARLRTTAYQKAVVMKYLDNLIAWGDQLFRRDTIETINEATQLYVLCADILGRRSESIPARGEPAVQTYNSLEPRLDDFSNAIVEMEHLVAEIEEDGVSPADGPPVTVPTILYFCVPPNEKLMSYWDTVADRLFKIRHCMNIEGVVRQLPLFEPPIDPGMLVRAVAAGVDLTSALSDVTAGLPHYRFAVMVQKASELAADLRALGGELLAALEKRDAEALQSLRSAHEVSLLKAVRAVREAQIEEARHALESLTKARDLARARQTYYANVTLTNQSEAAQLQLLGSSVTYQEIQAGVNLVANGLALIPNIKIGAPTSLGATFGGDNLGNAIKAFSSHMGALASIAQTEASRSGALGVLQRRLDEAKLNAELATEEIAQVEAQILAAEVRLALAERELENHDLQTEQAKEVEEHLRSKFTSRELYDWMVGQVASVFFQSYKLAYDVAKRAERGYRFELGVPDSKFIQFGYWDSLKKGLLSGERLFHDVKRMEMAYLERNRREYELTRHVSLAQLDPLALVKLRETGECYVDLPESLFDLDHPGHYMRRIKSVSLTIPCVTGPYTPINCTLTLVRNSMRTNATATSPYERTGVEDTRFTDNLAAVQSIATSGAQTDAGVFELSFRDERYLPFEGAGAISQWRIELPAATNRFDMDTVSDVVMHLSYTAREGGAALKAAATEAVIEASPRTGLRLLSARHELSGEWHRFLHPASPEDAQMLELPLSPERFPFPFRSGPLAITRVELFLNLREGVDYPGGGNPLTLVLIPPDGGAEKTVTLEAAGTSSPHAVVDLTAEGKGFGLWRLEAREPQVQLLDEDLREAVVVGGVTHHRLKPDALEDLLVVCAFSAS